MPRGIDPSYHKAKWGQHFLIDEQIIENIVNYAEIKSTDTILEIGGGTGNLTRKLAELCYKLIVIEADRLLAEKLGSIPDIEVLHGDALRVEFPSFDKTVSNLPYQISSQITFKLLKHPFKCGVLMYQKEFARRMVAAPGSRDYSRLTVCLSYNSKVKQLARVPKKAFNPRPKVDSVIVKLVPTQPRFHVLNEMFFQRFVSALFTQRRKTLKAALKVTGRLLNVRTTEQLMAELDPHRLVQRPYELSPEEIATLSNRLFELTKFMKDDTAAAEQTRAV
ncbi:MAG TPA: 16S rRNA (adenine(1518)-N(6)/adenine(1519)-N(6))-dimethyltransferase RsmA [Candidatus Bathyarchaeia archaeon]|nr:16S rRNA (adenine(1518)-N(6)/adenine(1519)-N(6))-dimethyltransferase RsmA [Candidatus Bathyarchaeia archaeon]